MRAVLAKLGRPTWALLAVLVSGLVTQPALARKHTELRYTYEQVWNAALRLVRVDLRLPVTDRDPEAGFILFEYLDHDKRFPGSLELIRGEKDKRPVTKVVVQVAGMPAYVEQMMIDRLGRKLKEEYGEPLAPEKPAPEKPKPPENPPSEEPKPEPDPNDPFSN